MRRITIFKHSCRNAILLLLTICVFVTSCDTDGDESSHRSGSRRTDSERVREVLVSRKYRDLPNVSYSFSNDSAPEITGVTVYSRGEERNLSRVDVNDMYGIDVYSSQVGGRTGGPIELDYSDDLSLIVEFKYDENELRGMDESNMSLIYYDEDTGFYIDVLNVIDTDANTLAFCPEEPGEYIMIGASSFSEIIAGNYEGPDYTEYESDWERNFDTGDIMQLADTQWALDNAPYFNVSTPEQLASVVWYTNVCASGTEYLEINIMNDIDLDGYDWAPMGTYGLGTSSFRGIISGNEHIIYNMTIDETGGGQNVGFIGHSSNLTMIGLGFVNAHVSGGRYTGIVGGQVYGSPYIADVYVSGEVEGLGEAGTILGREVGGEYESCFTDVTVNGEPNEYFSHRLEHLDTAEIVEMVEVTISSDGICTITRLPECPDRIWWVISVNGEIVRTTECEGETSFNLYENFPPQPGDVYTVYMNCHDGLYYIRCSNTAEITAD